MLSSQRPQCTLLAETLVIIPVVTAMAVAALVLYINVPALLVYSNVAALVLSSNPTVVNSAGL